MQRAHETVELLLAEDLISTSAEHAALAALRRTMGSVGSAMERHCLRVFLIIERLATMRGITIDREVALCASLFFDLGVSPVVATSDVYTIDGRRLARQVLARFAWTNVRLDRCLDAIERHHRLTSQWHRGVEVELLRRADLVDAFPAVFHFGLPRTWLAELFRRIPRNGLYPMLISAVWTMLRERPRTIPRIFLSSPSRRAAAQPAPNTRATSSSARVASSADCARRSPATR
jgi:hypothetical protein